MDAFVRLIGQTITAIGWDGESLHIVTPTGSLRMGHDRLPCEEIDLEDVIGDPAALIGEICTLAEEVDNSDAPLRDAESYTWTFYRFATMHGDVVLRWFGTSNGYYSASVNVAWVDATPTVRPLVASE